MMTCEEVRKLRGSGSQHATPSLFVAIALHAADCQECAEFIRDIGKKTPRTEEMDNQLASVVEKIITDPESPGYEKLREAAHKYMERTGQ